LCGEPGCGNLRCYDFKYGGAFGCGENIGRFRGGLVEDRRRGGSIELWFWWLRRNYWDDCDGRDRKSWCGDCNGERGERDWSADRNIARRFDWNVGWNSGRGCD
jgi:hypothetical protein